MLQKGSTWIHCEKLGLRTSEKLDRRPLATGTATYDFNIH